MLEQIERDELVRLRKIERSARACFMQTPPPAVAAHVQLALAAGTGIERLAALERALVLAGDLHAGANDKLLRRVHALHELVAGARPLTPQERYEAGER